MNYLSQIYILSFFFSVYTQKRKKEKKNPFHYINSQQPSKCMSFISFFRLIQYPRITETAL